MVNKFPKLVVIIILAINFYKMATKPLAVGISFSCAKRSSLLIRIYLCYTNCTFTKYPPFSQAAVNPATSSILEMAQSLAIIGAGLSGLSLALALHRQNIDCVLYESRAAPLDIGGAIMLSPNALWILNELGVLKRLEPRGYKFEKLYFRSEDNQPFDEFEFGSTAKYGYSGLRVYRFELISILLDMIREAGVNVEYGKKFDRILSETEKQVAWRFTDGSEGSASMVIGADGIHSRVRSYLYPDLQSKFTQMVGITAAVPTSQLRVDEHDKLPTTIMNHKHGAFTIAPQLADGSEVLIGKQYHFSDPEPESWRALTSDKTWCIDFLRKGNNDFPSIVGRATSTISSEKVNLWPFYLLPKLDTWSSGQSRVIILGDAAHAIPPTAGQGVNQAIEDIYTFAGVLGKLNETTISPQVLGTVLKRWLIGRQARIDRVLDLNAQINQRRMPGNDPQDMRPFDLGWLYGAKFDAMIDQYVSGTSS